MHYRNIYFLKPETLWLIFLSIIWRRLFLGHTGRRLCKRLFIFSPTRENKHFPNLLTLSYNSKLVSKFSNQSNYELRLSISRGKNVKNIKLNIDIGEKSLPESYLPSSRQRCLSGIDLSKNYPRKTIITMHCSYSFCSKEFTSQLELTWRPLGPVSISL